MLFIYLMTDPATWLIPWVLQAVAYYFILGKMGLKKKYCLIPFLAEKEFTSVLFKRLRSFWRPFIIAAVFMAGAYYLGPSEGTGLVYMLIAMVVYGFFLARLYFRLGKSFGKGILFRLGLIFIPTLFLLILGLGKSSFTAPDFGQEKKHSKFINSLRHITVVLFSAAEVILLVAGVGFYTVRQYPPRALATWLLDDVYKKTSSIESDGRAITREETMGKAAAKIADMPRSRKLFFPDHSGDKSVVVLEYIVGSNLEDNVGCATANIRMMQDATKKGDALTFVLETGGSRRWFTSGIEDYSHGRYTVKGGNVELVKELDEEQSMSEPDTLADFIKWGVREYPADRYMLVMWDHGGGVPYGFGEDKVNSRKDEENFDTIRVSEVVDAVRRSGAKFDVIGFDACLMQDLEIAAAFEPYADYYLASEESEGGYGWYYTSAFGKLAENPGLSSEEFGKDMVSAYDQFNTALNEGEKDTARTISFVDLTLAKPAADKVDDFFRQADEAIRKKSSDYTDIGVAAANTYAFSEGMQLDLIDFLEKLSDTDVNDSICSPKENKAVVNALKASVVFTNRDAAKGINGLAFGFPYDFIYAYSATSKELDRLSCTGERTLFNDIFSIIAVQKKRESDEDIANTENKFLRNLKQLVQEDFTDEDWYVKGFEDYVPATDLVDIPLTETKNGYKVELPEKTWKIITDCRTIAYQRDEDGRLRYLGSDHIGGEDENGHPTIDMGDSWVCLSGRLACYEAQPVRETEDGDVFTGIVRARLNGKDDINLYVEWDPVTDGETPASGHITGYEFSDNESYFTEKGMQTLSTGDRVQLIFDYYDDEGKLLSTEPYGRRIVVTKQGDLKVEDGPLGESDIEFAGWLTDVYKRDITTETIQAHISQ